MFHRHHRLVNADAHEQPFICQQSGTSAVFASSFAVLRAASEYQAI
jgi:hypothetical protein